MTTTPEAPPPAPASGRSSIGILGGTGPQGRGLARRFAAAGHPVVIGSRDPSRAADVAAGYAADPDAPATGTGEIRGDGNDVAAGQDLVVVAVPYEGHADLLRQHREALAGKIVVDCVNPLGFDSHGPYPVAVAAGSAAQEAAELLPDSTVIAAFHHVSSALLDDPAVARIELDVLVLGEDRESVAVVCDLAATIPGARGVYAGRLRNAGQVEAFTANLIAINRRYRAHAGLRITDVD